VGHTSSRDGERWGVPEDAYSENQCVGLRLLWVSLVAEKAAGSCHHCTSTPRTASSDQSIRIRNATNLFLLPALARPPPPPSFLPVIPSDFCTFGISHPSSKVPVTVVLLLVYEATITARNSPTAASPTTNNHLQPCTRGSDVRTLPDTRTVPIRSCLFLRSDTSQACPEYLNSAPHRSGAVRPSIQSHRDYTKRPRRPTRLLTRSEVDHHTHDRSRPHAFCHPNPSTPSSCLTSARPSLLG
jgi:hypothetical protein